MQCTFKTRLFSLSPISRCLNKSETMFPFPLFHAVSTKARQCFPFPYTTLSQQYRDNVSLNHILYYLNNNGFFCLFPILYCLNNRETMFPLTTLYHTISTITDSFVLSQYYAVSTIARECFPFPYTILSQQ